MDYVQCQNFGGAGQCHALIPYTIGGTSFCGQHQPVIRQANIFNAVAHKLAIEAEALKLDQYPDEISYSKRDIAFAVVDTDGLIDHVYASMLPYKRNHKGKPMLHDIHFRLQTHGTRNDTELFYAILHEVDQDFPFYPRRVMTSSLACCSKCKGWVWEKANKSPEDIKLAAKQAGIKVKIRLWLEGGKCKNAKIEQRIPNN